VPDGNGGFTLVGDADPIGDVCSTGTVEVSMAGKNIGDLLNAQNVTWGWFQGGFNLNAAPNSNGSYGCNRNTPGTQGNYETDPDYIQHHEPFQYYATTQNLKHLRPSAEAQIGYTYEADGKTPDPANHQYDSSDFFTALNLNSLPAVSFVKAPGYEDGHPGYSDPLDEQRFIVQVVNAVMASPEWASTAIVITYDDSDGWYDHQMPPIVNSSSSTLVDALGGTGVCTGVTGAASQQGVTTPATPLLGTDGNPALGRCGYGTRIPFIVISPYAKTNSIDHTLLDQSSIIRFIEDNWLGGQRIQAGGSFDTIAGSIENMFTFSATTPDEQKAQADRKKLVLDPETGTNPGILR
jgi:phospholipase C